MSETTRSKSLFSRLGRWLAELILVFVSVYAAFWLNNYQQQKEQAKRRDQILAYLEQRLKDGIESAKTEGAKEDRQVADFQRALAAGGPVHDENGVARPTLGVFVDLAESSIMNAQLRQCFTGCELEVMNGVIGFDRWWIVGSRPDIRGDKQEQGYESFVGRYHTSGAVRLEFV